MRSHLGLVLGCLSARGLDAPILHRVRGRARAVRLALNHLQEVEAPDEDAEHDGDARVHQARATGEHLVNARAHDHPAADVVPPTCR